MTQRVEVVELGEYGETLIDDTLAELVDAEFWAALGMTVSKSPGADQWTLKAGSLSGIARLRTRAADVTVRIEPKLPGADLVFLAEHAYGQKVEALRRPKADRVGIDSQHNDPIATLLIWYVDAVREFATRWLRRSYRTRRVILNSRVRGRVLTGPYINRSLTSARANEIPCAITERTVDTANNRVLKAGLRRVGILARTLPVPAAQRAVRRAVAGTLPLFADVQDVEVNGTQLRALSTRGPERHYENILATTTDLLQGRYLGQNLGQASVESFLWSMPDLFQEAVRGLLGESELFTMRGERRPTAKYYDAAGGRLRSSRIDPDYIVDGPDGIVLLDAKYKDALPGLGGTDTDLLESKTGPSLRVSRSDLYQLAAYRQHASWDSAPVALVYPVIVKTGDALPDPYVVQGLGDPIWLVFVDVGRHAREHVASFIQTIAGLGARNARRDSGASGTTPTE
ncbi:5-methylcytosine restriction system specificity protein McrC [Microbacterium sp.]|uniref:5-methylcytosine restriction system specificity protein McrC n=1 Tax=Microbacterium sp. TaxID=51671 RepID=UPI00391B08D6